MTNQKTVGLVVAPGVTERLAENLIQEMPKMLSTHYDHQQEWIFDLVTDPLTGFAESVDEIFGKVADYHDKRQWDYVIAITDLPMFADKQVMALDINMENGAAIFSYPAFGWRPVKKRFKHAIYNIIQELNEAEQESRNYDNNNQIENSVKKQFPLSKIDKETIYMKETDSSMWRLFGISIIAIIGMLIWIMMSHDLWEPVNKSNHKRITWLYNLTTIMTLIFAIIIYYIILYLLFLIAEIVLLPSGFLGQQVGLKGPAGIDLYLSIPWFAASISTVAGAIGAGLLNDELIKESTYGYRQRVRYEEQCR
ncbi:5,10-methylene-tetrahydrofolate dehydrogenase [Ralstonia insidiosa]|nr:5,10-methylene-tetrahydrofolate dehydrogenase [Ralstonia insidiosa]